MKRSLLALVFVGLALASLSSAKAAVETYDIDPVHTWVGFTVSHFFTKVPGYFSKVKGTIVVDRDHLENSTVEAVIEVASITTNTKMRDDDLRSTNFAGLWPGLEGGRDLRLGGQAHPGSARFRHRGGPGHDRQQRGCRDPRRSRPAKARPGDTVSAMHLRRYDHGSEK